MKRSFDYEVYKKACRCCFGGGNDNFVKCFYGGGVNNSLIAEAADTDAVYCGYYGDLEYYKFLDIDGRYKAIITDVTSATDIVIPEKINGMYVVYVNNNLFSDNNNIQSLEVYANATVNVSDCSKLTSVKIGNGNSCNYDRFRNCSSLTNVELPNGMTKIYDDAFYGCSSLKSINIPDSVNTISDRAFYNCASLTSIRIPDSVTSIGDEAFAGTPLLENQVGVKYVDTWVIGCDKDVKNIIIKDNTKHIADNAFSGSSLTSINVSADNENYSSIDGVLFNKDKTKLIQYPQGKKDIEYSIPDSVTEISGSAFKGCSSLKSVEIPKSVTSIGANAFNECANLESIVIKNDLCQIYNDKNTINFTAEIYGYENSTAEAYAEKYDRPFAPLKEDYSRFLTYNLIDSDNDGNNDYVEITDCNKTIKKIEIPDKIEGLPVKIIGASVFYDCTELTSAVISDSVESIGNNAFRNCRNLVNITIPESVKEINSNAFYNCESLEKITIHNPNCNIYDSKNTINASVEIYGYKNSSAQKYAEKYDRRFVDVNAPVVTTTAVTTVTTTSKTTASATTVASKKGFIDGVDNWSFNNSNKNFGYGNYNMKRDYLNKLLSGLNNAEKKEILNLLNSEWGGSCYGLASTSILSYYNILKASDWQKGANFLHDIVGPPSDDVESLINYYFGIQATDYITNYVSKALYSNDEAGKLRNLLDCLKDGSPTLLCFHGYFGGVSWGGHAVVAYGIEYGSWGINGKGYNGRVLVYDNNKADFDDNYCLYFNTSKMNWAIPCYGLSSDSGAILGLVSDDLDIINYHGYLDGSNKVSMDSFISILTSKQIASDYSLRKITMNSNGTYNSASTSEDDIKMFSAMSEDLTKPADIKFALKDSNKGYLMKLNKSEELDLSMRYENYLFNAEASNASQALFDPSGYVKIDGNDSDYELSIVANENYSTDWYEMNVSGDNADSVILKEADGGYILEGDNLANVVVKANNDINKAAFRFNTKYKKAFIYEIDKNTIGIKVDTDNNGTFETDISNEVLDGDFNLDGSLGVADIVKIQRYLVKKENDIFINSDLNGDGKTNIFDLIILKRNVLNS